MQAGEQAPTSLPAAKPDHVCTTWWWKPWKLSRAALNVRHHHVSVRGRPTKDVPCCRDLTNVEAAIKWPPGAHASPASRLGAAPWQCNAVGGAPSHKRPYPQSVGQRDAPRQRHRCRDGRRAADVNGDGSRALRARYRSSNHPDRERQSLRRQMTPRQAGSDRFRDTKAELAGGPSCSDFRRASVCCDVSVCVCWLRPGRW
jgi:hypothetical protein